MDTEGVTRLSSSSMFIRAEEWPCDFRGATALLFRPRPRRRRMEFNQLAMTGSFREIAAHTGRLQRRVCIYPYPGGQKSPAVSDATHGTTWGTTGSGLRRSGLRGQVLAGEFRGQSGR